MKSQSLEIKENIPLSRYTTFKLGGAARYFCEVRNEFELEEAIKFAKSKKLAAFFMGGGSNLVISDNGFDGLVVKMSGGLLEASGASDRRHPMPPVKMRMENGHTYLECWAGESLGSVVNMACQGSMKGLEWAAGIPGTLGGAVRGNAGAYGGSMADTVESVRVLDVDDMRIYDYKLEKCRFGYRNSTFKENEYLVVVSVVLRLEKGDSVELEKKARETIMKRDQRYPKYPSAGSFFQNPVVENAELRARFERDINDKCRDNKIAAGWLIGEVGLKGKKVGNIQVSEEHGNFLINLGDGKAADVVMLASLIKQKVRDDLGVQLVEEVKYVGF